MSELCLDDPTLHGKVCFPELGLDLVHDGDGDGGGDSDGVGCPYVVTIPTTAWQDNWLFRTHNRSSSSVRQVDHPVSMLVPNPVEAAKAQIGNKDFDVVSELSEHQSVASFELSYSESEEEVYNDDCAGQKKVPDESEKDQEYTIYDLLPIRRCQISSPSATVNPSVTTTTSLKNNFVKIANHGGSKGDLVLVDCPQNLTTHEGKIITLMCTVRGSKPLGSFIASAYIISQHATFRCCMVPRI